MYLIQLEISQWVIRPSVNAKKVLKKLILNKHITERRQHINSKRIIIKHNTSILIKYYSLKWRFSVPIHLINFTESIKSKWQSIRFKFKQFRRKECSLV